MKPPFRGFMMRKTHHDGKIEFTEYRNFHTKNRSVIRVIMMADMVYRFKPFDWVYVSTSDHPQKKTFNNCIVFSSNSEDSNYTYTYPDWTFNHWKEVFVYDYEIATAELGKLGDTRPKTNLLGWRGARTNPVRDNLHRFTNPELFDIKFVEWAEHPDGSRSCSNYVSLPDHVKKWRYLIDVQGKTYSGRTKFLFFTKRVLFFADSPYKEWYFERLVPWEHYVPVRSDLMDLEDNLNYVKSNPDLEDYIRHNAYNFAINNLRRINAIQRWHELITRL